MWHGQRTEKFSTFSTEAKVAVGVFLVVGVLGLAYSVRGVFFRLQQPFFAQMNYTGPKFLSLAEKDAQEAQAQKSRDTDGDTMNDYDELYVFRTSPYLTDTDSDGVDDAQEIRLGKDPTCPEGQDCLRTVASSEAEGEAPTLGVLPDGQTTLDFTGLSSTADVEAKIAKTSADDLRKILLGTGVSVDIIAKLNDEQVRTLFKQAVADAEKAGVLDQLLAKLPPDDASPSNETAEPSL